MNAPNWKLNADFETVTVTFPSTPPVALTLDVGEVESMLANLGLFRSHMKPEVPHALASGQAVGAVADPDWRVEPEAMEARPFLHLRDPRFGWLHFVQSREQARELGRALLAQADAPARTPPRAN